MPTSARIKFSRTPRQGTRALPYKALRYRARADRVVRPYKQFRRGDPCGRPRAGQSPSPTHHKIRFRRGRRLPTVVPTDSRSLSCPPIGALPRNRLASSATGSASPISPTARPGFFPHPRQGTRALPYKALRYRARADRVVHPYKQFRRGRCLHRPAAPLPLQKAISLPGRRTE